MKVKLPDLPFTDHADDYQRHINRTPSPVFAIIWPWLLVMLGSLVPGWLFITSAPIVPPLGFLILLAWRQVRPGLLPIWAGSLLGLFDDLLSGQPFGSAILLWSVLMLGLEILEALVPWRSFLTEWLVAAGLITGYIVIAAMLANAAGGLSALPVVIPQIILSVLIYPLVARQVARMDRLRLTRLRNFG